MTEAEIALIVQEARYGTDCPVSGDFDAAVRDAILAGYRAGQRETGNYAVARDRVMGALVRAGETLDRAYAPLAADGPNEARIAWNAAVVEYAALAKNPAPAAPGSSGRETPEPERPAHAPAEAGPKVEYEIGLGDARCPKCGARVESIGNPCPARCRDLSAIGKAPLDLLRQIEAHHVEQNRLKGRDEGRSTTLRLVREAIHLSSQVPGKDYQALYEELLYAVGNKYGGETRHQTALRYIQQAEQGDGRACQTREIAANSGKGGDRG